MTTANPQGKGLVPGLDAWRGAQPAGVEAKPARRILSDYFTSLLVLSAECAFKPCPGVEYYLYLAGQRWQLSLIAPVEWGQRAPGACLGQCQLRTDMTWRLEVQAGIEENPDIVDALRAFHCGFTDLLDREGALEDNLPYFVRELPYYRRLAAAGLSSSLRQSLTLSGLSERKARSWLGALAGEALALTTG